MLRTCRIDADHMREAVKNNWNLGPMGMDRVPVPYRFYGQDSNGPEPVVPWKEGLDALRAGSPQLHPYPGWDGMRETLGAFMDSLPAAPAGSTWVPGQGWRLQHAQTASETTRAPGVSAKAARSRSTTAPDGPRRRPSGGPATPPPAPGAAPQQERGRGHGR
ncbi:hypothetical protein GCM10023323_23650 [Streptomyces thinghirensis]|uniref:Uncharacterized protein n=2 Tax=Streptomyces thinghirensis TaxID=551547 RepID=A0ABP9T2E5_9ACTN